METLRKELLDAIIQTGSPLAIALAVLLYATEDLMDNEKIIEIFERPVFKNNPPKRDMCLKFLKVEFEKRKTGAMPLSEAAIQNTRELLSMLAAKSLS